LICVIGSVSCHEENLSINLVKGESYFRLTAKNQL
jgi:hypothetical protein